MLAKALGLSEGQPKNVLKCNEWFPCRTNKTGTHDATKKLGYKIKGFSSLLVYLLLAPFCDSAPSRESVKRAFVSALLRADGSLFYCV